MASKVILDKQDMTYLRWSYIHNSSKTADADAPAAVLLTYIGMSKLSSFDHYGLLLGNLRSFLLRNIELKDTVLNPFSWYSLFSHTCLFLNLSLSLQILRFAAHHGKLRKHLLKYIHPFHIYCQPEYDLLLEYIYHV